MRGAGMASGEEWQRQAINACVARPRTRSAGRKMRTRRQVAAGEERVAYSRCGRTNGDITGNRAEKRMSGVEGTGINEPPQSTGAERYAPNVYVPTTCVAVTSNHGKESERCCSTCAGRCPAMNQ